LAYAKFKDDFGQSLQIQGRVDDSLSEVFFHGHKTKSIVFGHTHKKIILKIFNYFFLSISSLLLKKYFFMYVWLNTFYLVIATDRIRISLHSHFKQKFQLAHPSYSSPFTHASNSLKASQILKPFLSHSLFRSHKLFLFSLVVFVFFPIGS